MATLDMANQLKLEYLHRVDPNITAEQGERVLKAKEDGLHKLRPKARVEHEGHIAMIKRDLAKLHKHKKDHAALDIATAKTFDGCKKETYTDYKPTRLVSKTDIGKHSSTIKRGDIVHSRKYGTDHHIVHHEHNGIVTTHTITNKAHAALSKKLRWKPDNASVTDTASAKKYYSMLEKLPSGRFKGIWTIQFGDYDRKVVTQEVADQKESGSFEKGTQFKIICTDHTEAAIQEAVKKLNGGKDTASSLDIAKVPGWETHIYNHWKDTKVKSNGIDAFGKKVPKESIVKEGHKIYSQPHDEKHTRIFHATGPMIDKKLVGKSHILTHKAAQKLLAKCKREDEASIESSLDVAGAEEHEKYKDHTKNPYYKVLTAHGFKHVSTEHKQNRFATNNPKHDYTEHLYKHPKHGKSHVVITQEHTKMRSDPQNHWLHRHEQSNGIMAPCHGNTKPQLDRDLTENYGGKSDKAAFERTDKHTKHVYALDKGTIVKSHNLPHNKTWLKKHPKDAERKLVTAQHAVSHVKRGDRLYVGKYDDANTWLLHLGSKDRAGFKCKHLLTNTSVKKLLAKCNKLENN